MLTQQQIEDRFSGIGGSDAAAVVGLSPRMTATELYFTKRGRWLEQPAGEDDSAERADWEAKRADWLYRHEQLMAQPEREDDDELSWLGHAIEPVLAQRYTERTGRRLRQVLATRRSKRHPFMLAHPDRLVTGERRGLELKMRVSGHGWGQEGTDQVPDDVLLQCQHYMAVHGYQEWDVLAFIGGTGTQLYHIRRDPQIVRQLVDAEGEFWHRVETGNPPPLDHDHARALAFVQATHPEVDGRVLQFPAEFEHWHAVLEDAKKHRDRYDAAVRAARAHIEDFMGDAARAFFADGSSYRRAEVERQPFEVEATRYVQLRHMKAPRTNR